MRRLSRVGAWITLAIIPIMIVCMALSWRAWPAWIVVVAAVNMVLAGRDAVGALRHRS